ncbi:mechanosensitive ion channel family protein [Echinicola shivajiensis]|uniref:mechanosensitive ion channel family protein n=1 Tax=Echinicola shivajiensis TaxID=1035916 RepID=UPI001BFC853A|nr:mechanosensitive ion channel family protein [Echinicola shivajiensis]
MEQGEGDISTILQSVKDSWNNFLENIPGIILGLVIIILGYLIAKKIGSLTQQKISRRSSDPLMSKFLGNAVKIGLFILAIIWAMNIAGLGAITAFLLTSLGASAIIIGFAFKDIGENFISGIILAFNRPFNVNDTVEIGELFGKIKSLEFRYTKLKTFDGRDVYIPNSDVLKKPVINYTEDGFFRWDFVVGLAYEDDLDQAKEIIMETVNKHPSIVQDGIHENYVAEDALATSTVNLKVFFWVNTFEFRKEAVMVKGEIIKQVKQALETNGFALPSDIIEVKLYGSQKELPVKILKEKNGKT